ncbi:MULTISPECIES: hypothetical protein [Methylobacteriaceae]|uniref:hypothetical protein n=1 Tax=Methylobacteriaceae TaxID=119045 RepID=UPI001168ED5C|nr:MULTISPECIES: hypothetical protein [Methylobacteriaceae]GEL42840.1 hypothetical protein MEX01_34310 [Methylorubrum extorquens]
MIERLKEFSDHRILLVAHSMGSVIAYDVLRILERDTPGLKVEHLVTAGSPLGLAKVKLKIEAECGVVRVPNNVRYWTNLADGNDIVAVTGALAGDFVPSDTGVEVVDHRVVNDYRRPTGEPNHHKSYGYLRTPEFSRIAAGFIGELSRGLPTVVPQRLSPGHVHPGSVPRQEAHASAGSHLIKSRSARERSSTE